jgi:hypothetical protein
LPPPETGLKKRTGRSGRGAGGELDPRPEGDPRRCDREGEGDHDQQVEEEPTFDQHQDDRPDQRGDGSRRCHDLRRPGAAQREPSSAEGEPEEGDDTEAAGESFGRGDRGQRQPGDREGDRCEGRRASAGRQPSHLAIDL